MVLNNNWENYVNKNSKTLFTHKTTHNKLIINNGIIWINLSRCYCNNNSSVLSWLIIN